MSCGTEVLTPTSAGLEPAAATFSPASDEPQDAILDRPKNNFSIVSFPGRGKGLQVHETVKSGDVIIRESAAVIGPKQTSPLVCVECFKMFPGKCSFRLLQFYGDKQLTKCIGVKIVKFLNNCNTLH